MDVDNDDGDRSRSADTLVDAVNGLLETSPLKALEQALVRATLDGPSVLDAMLVGEIVDDPQEMARRSPVATEVYLKSLSVTGFRGVGPLATLDIEPGPGLTLVVGRNGSGKSSFADGLELLLTGSAWRWQDKSKVWTAGWRNLHHPQKALVSAEFIVDGVPSPVVAELAWADADGLEEGIRTSQPRGQKVQPLSDLGWEEAVDTARPFLSYSELGSLLDVGPTRLYDSLSRILGLDRLVEGTENLRQQRLARNKALKTVKGSLASEVLPRLSESNDPRARRCEQALALKPWDLDVISQLVGASGTVGEPDDLSELRRLSILVSPGHRIVEDMIAELRRLETDRAALRSTDSGNAAQVSNLLSAALTHYDEHGETDCPVCGTIGIIDDQWARATREQLAALEATAQRYRSAQAELKNAMTVLRQLPTTSDISKGSISQLIDDANGALQALDAWNRAISETDPLSAADLLESTIEPALVALAAIRSAASCELEKREDEWKPVADAVRRWLHSATSAIADVDAVAHIETAEKWLRAATDEIRTHRFEPIGQQSQDIWSKLSIQSNVHISDVLLTGSATGRKVEIQIDVDGKEGVALGVMSQGELHSLVLSLYLPRARMEESPFRFVVIDDPVQAMDPSRVDGLASVLHEMATDRQVIVFTHDDRLPEAVRRLQIPARIVEVHRRPQSVVELRDSLDPVQQALADAWAVSRSSGVPNDVQRRVVAGFCRSALETASIESFRRRRLSSGKPYTDVEAEVSRATRLSHYLSLALFDDLDSGGRVLSTLKQKWGPQAADTYQACNKGVHSTYGGDLTQLVNEGRSLAERIRQL